MKYSVWLEIDSELDADVLLDEIVSNLEFDSQTATRVQSAAVLRDGLIQAVYDGQEEDQ